MTGRGGARSKPRRWGCQLGLRGLALLTMGTSALVTVFVPVARADDVDSAAGLSVIGRMSSTVTTTVGNRQAPPRLLVDERHNLGFAAGRYTNASNRLVMYDLETLREIKSMTISSSSFRPELWAVDEGAERIYLPSGPSVGRSPECTSDQFGAQITIVGYADTGSGRTFQPGVASMPCSGLLSFAPRALTLYDSPETETKKLLASGYLGTDFYPAVSDTVFQLPGISENVMNSLLVRQMDLRTSTPTLDWEIDLRDLGCGRRDTPWVHRTATDVYTYCFDARPLGGDIGVGRQGYLVRIPLQRDAEGNERPKTVGDPVFDPVTQVIRNPVGRRTPTLGGPVTPVLDPVSGLVLLSTADGANGNAVWVFDPIEERFVGVVSGGFSNQPTGNSAVGFDAARGRVYILTAGGVLVVSARQFPLPPGDLQKALVNAAQADYFVSSDNIAVAPRLQRVFVAVTDCEAPDPCPGWAVLHDDLPEPEAPPPGADLDLLTTQIDEVEGETEVEASGAAQASGAHLVGTGGLPRVVNGVDPFCHSPFPPGTGLGDTAFEREAFEGQCVADLVVTPGNREAYFASTEVAAVAGASTAHATGAQTTDQATDADVRRIGACGSSDAAPACDPAHEGFVEHGAPDARSGTPGPDGEGFPVKGSHCDDPGGTPTGDAQPEGPGAPAQQAFASSSVRCESASNTATAQARSSGLHVGDGDTTIAVALLASSVETKRTSAGQETFAISSARGVVIGPLTIGEVRTEALTKARGRTGTASAEFTRAWCDVQGPGVSINGCFDPAAEENADRLDTINQALGRIRLSVVGPEVEATPGGYQAVVTKDLDVRAADRAVNDDDSFTVSGLQAVVYNDGTDGRSRFVLQLAGVHTESRYGITAIPSFTGDEEKEEPEPEEEPPVETDESAPVEEQPGPDEPPTESLPQDVAGIDMTEPGADYEVVEAIASTRPESFLSLPAPGRPLVERALRVPADVVRRLVALLVNRPGEFGLLLALWTLLAAPVYLALRRRQFAFTLAR